MTEPTDPGPTVIVVRDAEDNAHWTAAASPFAVEGLADGSLTEHVEESPDAKLSAPADGPDAPPEGLDTAGTDDGPGDGEDGDTPAPRRRTGSRAAQSDSSR